MNDLKNIEDISDTFPLIVSLASVYQHVGIIFRLLNGILPQCIHRRWRYQLVAGNRIIERMLCRSNMILSMSKCRIEFGFLRLVIICKAIDGIPQFGVINNI